MDYKDRLSEIDALLAASRDRLILPLHKGSAAVEELERILPDVEWAALRLRMLLETIRPRLKEPVQKPPMQKRDVRGSIEVNEFGWVHLSLNTLLPSCHYRTPEFFTQTISDLLDRCPTARGHRPYFEKALLVIDEHCDIESRQVYDQDNKGYKAVSNAIKGVLIPDDDQFTLELALLSTLDETPSCQIYLLPADEAGEFFSLRSGQYGVFL